MIWPLSVGNWRPLIQRLPSSNEVALTFDDGPTPETTPRLLQLLDEYHAKATFFVSGVRAAANPHLVEAVVARGHSVYGHGWEHINLENAPARAVADMRRVEAELSRHRPTPAAYMLRLPYNAGYARARIHRAMEAFHPNIHFVWWSHSTFDYLIPQRCRTHDEMVLESQATARALRRSGGLAGGILLLHEQPFDIDSPINA